MQLMLARAREATTTQADVLIRFIFISASFMPRRT